MASRVLLELIGRQIEFDFNGVAIGRPDHLSLNLVSTFLISICNGLKVPSTQPMIMTSLTGYRISEFSCLTHPLMSISTLNFSGACRKTSASIRPRLPASRSLMMNFPSSLQTGQLVPLKWPCFLHWRSIFGPYRHPFMNPAGVLTDSIKCCFNSQHHGRCCNGRCWPNEIRQPSSD